MAKKNPPAPSLADPSQAQPRLQGDDIHNLMVAARIALPHLNDRDLVNVSASIARVGQGLAAIQRQQAEVSAPAPSKEAPAP